jgi:hypothetical protein
MKQSCNVRNIALCDSRCGSLLNELLCCHLIQAGFFYNVVHDGGVIKSHGRKSHPANIFNRFPYISTSWSQVRSRSVPLQYLSEGWPFFAVGTEWKSRQCSSYNTVKSGTGLRALCAIILPTAVVNKSRSHSNIEYSKSCFSVIWRMPCLVS